MHETMRAPARHHHRRKRKVSRYAFVPKRMFLARLRPPLTPKQIEHIFDLVKLDYGRLIGQEQLLLNGRREFWSKFGFVLSVPTALGGFLGLRGAIYSLAVVPFLLTCISLESKHDESVLRYDVRRGMKKLAAQWKFANHDAQYAPSLQAGRWWHGFYKPAKAAALVLAEIIASAVVSWYLWINGMPALGVGLATLNVLFTIFTCWCMF